MMQRIVELEKERVFEMMRYNEQNDYLSEVAKLKTSIVLISSTCNVQITITDEAKRAENAMVGLQEELKEKTDYIVKLIRFY